MQKSSLKPRPKVAAAAGGGTIATLAVFVAAQFGVDMSAEVGAAIATVIAFAGGYLRKDNTES